MKEIQLFLNGFSIRIPSIVCPEFKSSVNIMSTFAEYAATIIIASRKDILYFSSISDALITDIAVFSMISQHR